MTLLSLLDDGHVRLELLGIHHVRYLRALILVQVLQQRHRREQQLHGRLAHAQRQAGLGSHADPSALHPEALLAISHDAFLEHLK